MSSHDPGEHGLLVELNVVQSFEGQAKVTKEAVNSQQANDGEVTQHAVEVLGAVLSSNGHGVLIAAAGGQLLCDVGSLDQRVKNVEDAVAAPGVWILAKDLDLLFVVRLSRNSHAVGRKGVELVDEFVDDIPGPVVLHAAISIHSVFVHRVVGPHSLTEGGSRSTGPSELRMKWNKLQ